MSYNTIRYDRRTIDGVGVHYQEAGDPSHETVVLLHGFPSTSRMWDRLIPALAAEYHVIAPDYPGFGLSDAPPPARFEYTFDHLTAVMRALLERLGVSRYALIAQDYGGPIAFRLALTHPERLSLLVLQNAAASETALGPKWDLRKEYWKDPKKNLAALQVNLLSLETARGRHIGTSPHPDRYDPNTWTDEFAMLSRPGEGEIQSTLFYDYRTKVASYPAWLEWLRAGQPRVLVTWGRYDTSFDIAGAQAIAKDNPNAELHILEAGHFPLDEAPDAVIALTTRFLSAHLPPTRAR